MTNALEALSYSDCLRYRRTLRHATEALLSHGYAATSVEDIAIDAGVSKMTIYRLFVDKLGLASAVMEELAGSLEMHCRRAIDMASPAEVCLARFGVTYLKWMLMGIGKTHNYALTRLLMEMSSSHPDFARTWVETHHKVIVIPLSQYIEKRVQAGEISNEKSAIFIASQFIANIIHTPGILILQDKSLTDYNKNIEELVESKVQFFLRGACGNGPVSPVKKPVLVASTR